MIEETHIILGMLSGFVAMILMAGFIVAFILMYQRRQIMQEKQLSEVQREYQKSLLETALESEETERRRMAGELHDDIGVMLSLTKMSVNQLSQRVQTLSEEKEMVENIRKLLDETMVNVRRISKALVPSTLEQFGLEAAIEDLVSKHAHNPVPKITFREPHKPLPRQTPKTELALFRIVQELVNNAIKHAQASLITIELYTTGGKIRLVVQDNGKGFDAESVRGSRKAGLGLRNIESRLSVINGSTRYSHLNPGTKIEIEVPLVTLEEKES